MPRKWGEVEFPRCIDIVVLVELTQGPETEVTIKITSNLLVLEMETLNLREGTSSIALMRNWGFQHAHKDPKGIQWKGILDQGTAL